MGYTHYLHVKKTASVIKIGRAVCEMAAVVQARPGLCSGWDGTGKPEFKEGFISFNGSGGEGCETFMFPPEPNEWDDLKDKEIFSFCKTRQLPYDEVVTACLAIAKDVMGDDIRVVSDGHPIDWEVGVALASTVTKRKISNPIEEGG